MSAYDLPPHYARMLETGEIALTVFNTHLPAFLAIDWDGYEGIGETARSAINCLIICKLDEAWHLPAHVEEYDPYNEFNDEGLDVADGSWD